MSELHGRTFQDDQGRLWHREHMDLGPKPPCEFGMMWWNEIARRQWWREVGAKFSLLIMQVGL